MAAEEVESIVEVTEAEESLEASSYSGQCKRKQPWGKVYMVILQDGPYLTCTHKPAPHTYKL